MVRFAWTLGEGAFAHAQRHRSFSASHEGGLHLAICVEIPGRPDVRGICFTVPPKYLQPGMVKETGFLIAHGGGKDAASQNANNKLHSELAVAMASQGYVVIRCQCVGSKDSQDQSARMAVRACATSPYGAAVKQWILIGISIGGNAICRVHHGIDLPVIGIVLISMPLDAASASTGKSSRNNKSSDLQAQMEVCLRKVKAPLLFVQQGGQSDGAHLRRLLDVTGSLDRDRVRMLLINKKAHEAGALHFQPYNMKALVKAVQDYMQGIMADDLSSCDLPTPDTVAEMVVAYSAALGEDSSEALPPSSGKGGPSKAKKAPGASTVPKVKVKTKSGAPVVASSAAKRKAKGKEPGEPGQKRKGGGDSSRTPGQPKGNKVSRPTSNEAHYDEQGDVEGFSWRGEESAEGEEPHYWPSNEGGGSPHGHQVRFVAPAFAPVGDEAAGYAFEEDAGGDDDYDDELS